MIPAVFIVRSADNFADIVSKIAMVINNLSNLLQPLIQAAKADMPSLIDQLKVGQMVPARVISMPSPQIAKLLMLGNEVTAQTNIEFKPGQQLQLQVVKEGPQPQLQIQQAVNSKQVSEQFIVLKDALPKQQLPQEVQQSLKQILNSPVKTEVATAKLLSQIIENKAIPAQQISPSAVKASLQQSGLFLEAQLAQGHIPKIDTKADMLRLLMLWVPRLKEKISVKQRPEQNTQAANSDAQAAARLTTSSLLDRLVRLLEGSIARVQTHQAASLPSEDGNRQVWQFEIPIRLQDDIDQPLLQIEREERHKEGQHQATWTISLAFNFDNIGPVNSRILLEGEAVSATFWSENQDTTKLIQEKIPLLEAALRNAGLEVGRVVSAQGRPQDGFMSMNLEHSLLDERV